MTKEKRDELIALSNRRYATKSFDSSKKISEEDLITILEAGRLSPSSFGYEPWKFLVIKNKDLREKLKEISIGARNVFAGEAELVIILYKKGVVYNSDHVKNIVENVLKQTFDLESPISKGFKSFQENLLELRSPDDIDNWAKRQTYIALGNMLTAAAMLDIDSVAIEGFQLTAVTKLLESEGLIDDHEYGVSVMAGFGYRNEEIKPKKRRSFDEVVKIVE